VYGELYLSEIKNRLDKIIATEMDKIAQIAQKAARSIANGGAVHILDNGHLLGAEMTARAGGLGLSHMVTVDDVKNPVFVRKGDILFVVSVSGRSRRIVEAALVAKKRGVYTVALTARAQNGVAEPEDKKLGLLPDVTDIVLDIHGVAGDAIIDYPELGKRAIPASGILSVAVMWAFKAELISELWKLGIEPTIYTSVNIPGGEEAFRKELERYAQRGY
jgi:uncharacterized phosphosugar-binding protein